MSGGHGRGWSGSHSLAFRVMRLCRPSFHVDPVPLRVDPPDLLVGEDIIDDPLAAANLPRLLHSSPDSADLSYGSRFLLQDSSDSIGLSGLLVLPQALGAIYLGETICSYISMNNSSNIEVRDVVIKAEIQTERQRILLLDTSKSPVDTIRAGGRYDFIVEHNVKELGAHTSVLLRYDNVKEATFLEACIENHTKSNLFMDQVEFEPAPHWSATMLKPDEHRTKNDSQTRETFKASILIKSGGGIYNYLYQLKLSSQGSAQMKVEGSNVLGKLQIRWRANLGEPGRLQIQQILGNPIMHKEIELHVTEVPSVVNLERPFSQPLNLTNLTDRELGPFEVCLSQDGSLEDKVVMVNGLQKLVLPGLEAFGSTTFTLNLIATKLGVQKITGNTLFDTRERKSYEPLQDLEIFVDLD